uniref:C-type lectin domain-containing protein n=1 Tax=Pseudonaja textilis TaxID=8673 RepID=A0A670ZLA2_PSETE
MTIMFTKQLRPCPTDWIGYQMKCFYFSDKEETWSASQDFCSLYNASLAVIEEKEMDFVQRYKGSISHWIGLQRDPKQPWKWVNGNASTINARHTFVNANVVSKTEVVFSRF